MPVHLQLTTHDGICQVAPADTPDQPLAATPLAATPLADLPTVDALYQQPYSLGSRLFQALGGAALLGLLETSDADLLLLECDDLAGAVAWEYAVTDEQRFLACDYGLLRLEPRDPRPTDTQTPPRLLVLCADPLRYQNNELPADQLQFEQELQALSEELAKGTRALAARRLPPTAGRLIDSLADGPALLHFSCHGTIVAGDGPPDVALSLEDAHGVARPLLGRDLRRDAPRGSIRMVLLSACQSAMLAQAFVRDGVPVALGMQHTFPDTQSAVLAATFYRWLAAGHNVAEAARQARRVVAAENPRAVGLLVAYTCQDAWGALPLPNGQPDVDMRLPMRCSLPESVSVPAIGLLGRNAELIEVAQALDTHPVVTVIGVGGMGKTSLAAACIQRFGWRFGRVLGVTFASASVDVRRVCRELLERAGLGGDVQAILTGAGNRDELVQALRRRLHAREVQRAQYGSHTDPAITIEIEDIEAELAAFQADDLQAQALARLRERLLDAVRPGDLLLFDNYESVLTPAPGDEVEAQAIARLVALLQGRGAKLLLTSRAAPAGLTDEALVPSAGLAGLEHTPAEALFLRSSTRASGGRAEAQHTHVAQVVARVTEGYPLAIQLLSNAYDHSSSSPEHFLDQWPTMLAHAERQSFDPRHTRFATAVAFSLTLLSAEQRARLATLAIYDVPFFAEGAVFLWNLPLDDDGQPTVEALDTARDELALFVNRSMLQVEASFVDDYGTVTGTPASYRFPPPLRQELRRVADATLPPGYTAYGAWLARRAYGAINRDVGLSNLVLQSMALLEVATAGLQGDERLWHIRRVAWIRQQYGDHAAARPYYKHTSLISERSLAPNHPETIATLSNIASAMLMEENYADARLLYEELLTISEQIGNLDLSATAFTGFAKLHFYLRNYNEAIDFAQQALTIREDLDESTRPAIGEIKEVLGLAYQDKGDLAVALPFLEQAVQIYQQSLSEGSTEAIQTLNSLAMICWEMQDSQSAKQFALLTKLLSSTIRQIEPDNDVITTIVENITTELGSIVASASEQSQGAALNRIIGQFDTLNVQIERFPSTRDLLGPILQRWRVVVSRVAGQIGRLPTLRFMTSPYVFTVPIQSTHLIGRDDLFRRIETLWSRPGQRNSILIHGHRRMGKTSVAQALQSRCNFGDDTHLCYLTMEGVDLKEEGFLWFEIAYQFYQLCEGRTNEPSEKHFLGVSPRTAFKHYIQQINKVIAPLRVILVLDEFEQINRHFGRATFCEIIDFLRAKTQTYHWLALALVGLSDLADLSRLYQATVLGWEGIRVSFLSPEQVRQVLIRPPNVPDVFLDYTKEAVQLIAELTNGQPYLVQVIGDRLVELYNQRLQTGQRNLTTRLYRTDVEAIIADQSFYDSANAYFSGVWSQFEREQPLLTVVAAEDNGINEQTLRSTVEDRIANFDEFLRTLLRHEILFQEDGHIRISVPLMHKWVLRTVNQRLSNVG